MKRNITDVSKKVLIICCLMTFTVVLLLTSCGSGGEPAPDDGSAADRTAQQEEQSPDGDKAAQEDQNSVETQEEVEEEHEVDTDIITVNTQSSIRIAGSKTIYVDPYKRTKAAHDADVIFITHAHYDHYDEPSLRNVAKEDSVIVCPASMLADVTAMDICGNGENIIAMEAGEEKDITDGVAAEAVPAYNLNKNFHPKANGWLGYVIAMDGVRYYAAGDTDALTDLEDVECDVAFFPVGGTYTATAAEAAGLVNKIHPAVAIPIHYGTIVGRAADADTFKAALDDDIKVVKKVEDAR